MRRKREREPGEPHLLRLQKVAQMLDCSVRHINTLCARGLLERVSIGNRSTRITCESLARFLDRVRAEQDQ